MKKILISFLIAHFAFLISQLSEAQIIHVPADQPTIQAGIDAAGENDTVLVEPGIYYENISIYSSAITVASLYLVDPDPSYISQTVIDGGGIDAVVYFGMSTDATTLLCGFTIRNGGSGGIYCNWSDPVLKDLIVTGNYGESGAGVCCNRANPTLINVNIFQNHSLYSGGGISCGLNSNPYLENVTIAENSAGIYGGGIYISSSGNASFDTDKSCNIYLNAAKTGSDLYSDTPANIVLDTFTVLHPNRYYAAPIENFTFNIIHGKIEQVNADLYVSPGGDDNNSGLTEDDPLKTIYAACRLILPDSLNTVNLLEGTYSTSTNGEIFPVELIDYIQLQGVSPDLVKLDAEGTSSVISEYITVGTSVSGMTITGGNANNGGGINSGWSKPVFKNLVIKNNSAFGNSQWDGGGGMYLFSADALVENVRINDNSAAGEGGGITIRNTSNVVLKNVTVVNNEANRGGGIFIGAYVTFDSTARCNIYFNLATAGRDLCTDQQEMVYEVFADTFSVMCPTTFYAEPLGSFAFDILHGMTELVNADLYVSPNGDNNNTGLTETDPLKTMQYAFSRIQADSAEQHTIHLLEGTYSNSATGEIFPVNMTDYVSLSGASRENVILDAGGLTQVLMFNGVKGADISNLTITGGKGGEFTDYGGGVNCLGSNPIIQNVTITGNSSNSSYYGGGGLLCYGSDPVLIDVDVNNNAAENGAGIYIMSDCNLTLTRVNITGNIAENGGGIYADYNTAISLQDVTLANNSASLVGGGAYFNNTNAGLQDVIITGNSALIGGGLSFYSTSANLDHVLIENNYAGEQGGGLYSQVSNTYLKQVTIRNNRSDETGGGMYFTSGTTTEFDSTDRCSIYLNYSRQRGRDLYSNIPIEVIVDTFTVKYPSEYIAYPSPNFTFDILHGLIEQVDADVYVSPDGDNSNSGISAEEPLKNIDIAFIKIIPVDSSEHAVNLLEGTYSYSSTGEIFPLYIPEYINVSGISRDEVILEGEGLSDLIVFDNNSTSTISGLTISGCRENGILCYHSSPEIDNIKVINNNTNGIYCNQNSGPQITNSLIENNTTGIKIENSCNPLIEGTNINGNNPGIYCTNSAPILRNVEISNNYGGMIANYSYPDMQDVEFRDNSGNIAALSCHHSYPQLDHVSFTGNKGNEGGGFYCANSQASLQDVKFEDNYAGDGGGIYFDGSQAFLKTVNIIDNEVWRQGGGIYSTGNSELVFDTAYRCNIYFNRAATDGNDLFSDHFMEVVLDTFTVLYPTDYQAYKVDNFSFDILHGLIPQVNADVYVSPDGNNGNSGLTPADPLKNIYYALNSVLPDSLYTRQVNLLEGTYGPSLTGEKFPLTLPNYIALSGVSKENVLLDAERQSGILALNQKSGITVSGLTLMNADQGNAIRLEGSHTILKDLIVKNSNYGGIVSWSNDTTTLINVSIHDNKGFYGGGILCEYDSKVIFDQSDRCNIYDNYALYYGNDLYTSRFLDVYVDTFSVMNPDNFHAYPVDSFAFDINNGRYAQTSQDLYISPSGNNLNDGLTKEAPLRNIHTALTRSLADDLNRQAIFLAEGIYSPSATSEYFPIRLRDYISIAGTSAGKTILDAEDQETRVIYIEEIASPGISDLTITGGGDGGLYCSSSNLNMQNVIIKNNHGAYQGGGALFQNECYPVLKNVVVADNCTGVEGESGIGGGLYFHGCSPVIVNSTIVNNNARDAGGIYLNLHPWYMSNYDAYVKNTIIWNNVPGQGYLYSWGEDKGLWLSWSDIMGGKNSIVCSDTLSLHWLEGNIDADPVFINSGDFPYAISFNSPCLDAGILDTTGLNLPVKDITGNPRVWNGRIDMGAMEWNSLGYEELRVSGSGLRVICYPNPTDGKINLQFTIYSLQSVTVVIYDLNGREVTTVLDEKLPAGEHTIRWDAGNLPAGMYFYRLTTDDCHLPTATGKILLH